MSEALRPGSATSAGLKPFVHHERNGGNGAQDKDLGVMETRLLQISSIVQDSGKNIERN